MNPFTYKNKTIVFQSTTGIVIGASKLSETHVSSSGGGGYLKDGTGYVSAPTVRSHVINRQEFFIKTESGEEVPITLINKNVPLRDEHKITAVAGYREGQDSGYWVSIVNYNARRYWYLWPGGDLVNLFKLAKGYTLHLWAFIVLPFGIPIGGMVGAATQWLGWTIAIATVIATVWIIYDLIYTILERKKISRLLSSHINQIADSILASDNQYNTSS